MHIPPCSVHGRLPHAGADGVDAIYPDTNDTDGKVGENGGQVGSGTNGADLGNKPVSIGVKEKDLYLLMAIDPYRFCQNLLI